MRNNQLYRATYTTKSSQVSSPLSKELQKKYMRKSIRVLKGDTVKVIRGEHKGIDGKISRVAIDTSRIAIEGVKKEKTRGEKFDVFIHTSNIMVTDINGQDKWRKRRLEGQKGIPKKTPSNEEEKGEIKVDQADSNNNESNKVKEEGMNKETDQDDSNNNESNKVKEEGMNKETDQADSNNNESNKVKEEGMNKETDQADSNNNESSKVKEEGMNKEEKENEK